MANTLYSVIKNPLTEENLEKIIESYTKHHSMYSALTRVSVDKKITGKYNVEDCNAFYAKIFHDWKRAITYLYKENRVKPEYQNELIIVYNYIKDKAPTTKNEVIQIMDYEEQKEPLKSALNHFRWDSIGEYSGWDHIHSNYINFGLHGSQTIRHRLYINCDSTLNFRLMRRFIEKCNQRHLSYYFKFDIGGFRDDSMVIYSDAKHIGPYIQILREIKKEEKLDANLHQPPVLTSTIDGWIGYGSEPIEKDNSFNSKRSEHLEECINKESTEWMMRNLNSKFRLNGKEITYKEYFINHAVKIIKESITRYARDDESYLKYHGYQKHDLETTTFKNLLRSYIISNFSSIMNYYQTGFKNFEIEIPFKNGKVKISKYHLEDVKKDQISFMYKNSTRFRKDLLQRIQTTSVDKGIDPDNYSCDSYVLGEIGKGLPPKIKNIKPTSNVRKEASYQTIRKDNRGVIYQKPIQETNDTTRKK